LHTRKSAVVRAAVIALLILLSLELALQLAFPHLPLSIIQQMPQFRARMGFQLDTAHGVQEYPAGQTVNYKISQTSGDLYRLTCLSPDDAPPFDTYSVSFQRDAHGFRNPEPWPDKVNLVVIGDSFTAAEAIVEPFWHDISDSILVFGLPGTGTLQQQRLLQAYALPRQPDIVVLAYFAGNDLQDSLTFSRKTQAEDGGSSGTGLANLTIEHFVLFNIAYALRNVILPGEQAPCHYPQFAATDPPTPLAFYDEFLSSFALDSPTLRASEMFRITSESIIEMAETLETRGARFILMYIPQKAELYWELLSAETRAEIVAGSAAFDQALDPRVISEHLPAQRNLMAELASELNIVFLDLARPLSSAISEGEQPYFFADTHWNQTGHNIARIALLDLLNQSNLDM